MSERNWWDILPREVYSTLEKVETGPLGSASIGYTTGCTPSWRMGSTTRPSCTWS